MSRKQTLPPQTFQSILDASRDIIRFAKKHHRYPTPVRLQNQFSNSTYEQAKIAQTQQRNLTKAAFLYADSACQGVKLDSCIKDFASIVHQMGETYQAVQFLLEVRPYYHGDFKKFDRLLNTLQKQLKPSKKHQCKSLLFELPSQSVSLQINLQSMFQNTSRIKSCKYFAKLDFIKEQSKGKWMVLQFESFSAAKKTLQKFKQQDWFMVNKFWLRDDLIVCQAKDGWDDFEEGLLISDQILQQGLIDKYIVYKWSQVCYNRELINYLALRLIEEDMFFRVQQFQEFKNRKQAPRKSILL